MTVLVTGAQGFLARHFVAHVLTQAPGVRIVGIGRSPRCDEAFTHCIHLRDGMRPAPVPVYVQSAPRHPCYEYRTLDITDESALTECLRDVRPAIVVHLAAALRDSEPVDLVRSNMEGTLTLLRAIGRSGVRLDRFVLGSSGGVYGRVREEELPIRETTACRPADLYSSTKWVAEQLVETLASTLAIPVVCARIFNLMGPGQDERHVTAWLASQLTTANDRAVQVRIGATHTTRDFIDVRDAAAALWLLAHHPDASGPYNVATGIEHSIGEILDILMHLVSPRRTEILREPPRRDDIPRHYGDICRLAALGFRIQHDLESSLSCVVNYYRQFNAPCDPDSESRSTERSYEARRMDSVLRADKGEGRENRDEAGFAAQRPGRTCAPGPHTA